MDQDRQLVEAVRARVNAVEVISRYVRLREQGSNWVGRCPFHEERTPSFTVSPHNGMFYCFGCGAGGDVFTFLMRAEKLAFPEALERLASQVGLSLPRRRGSPSPELRLQELSERVTRHFEANLQADAGAAARAYLERRGITPEAAQKFRLGYALPGWRDLLQSFRRQARELQTLGLVLASARGRTYDRFRERLMFPLCDAQGRVLGFAGRQLHPDEKAPKYVNTPNTPLMKKGTLLYGLHLARAAPDPAGTLVLVEGYTDVIAAHQHGLTNVVASMGTALTAAQVRLCARHAQTVVLALDQDVAGQAATLRGIQALLEEGVEVLLAQLPANTDPDGLMRAQGGRAFEDALHSARPFFELYVDALCRSVDARTFAGKQQVLSEALTFLQGLENLHWRGHLTSELAAALDLPNEEIERELRRKSKGRSPPPPPSAHPDEVHWGPEEHVLYFLLQGQLSVERATAELEDEDFGRYCALWEAIKAEHARQGTVRLEALYDELEEADQKILSRLEVNQPSFFDLRGAVEQALCKLKLPRLERTVRALQRAQKRAETSGDHERAKELLAHYADTYNNYRQAKKLLARLKTTSMPSAQEHDKSHGRS